MGRNNRTRHRNEPPLSPRERVEQLLAFATSPHAADFERSTAIELLGLLDRSVVRHECERQALVMIGTIWNSGWQPAECARHFARATNASVTRLALVAIAADHASRHVTTLDPRWISQLDALDLPRVGSATGWLGGWAEAEHASWPDALCSATALLRCFASLSRLPILIPPPGARTTSDWRIDLTSRTNDPMLNRVRALLAQAESTTFDAEAESFTAKAQELMTRHAIDMAMVTASADGSAPPLTIRVPIDDPYVDAKSQLLHFVARESRCRSVFHPRVAMSSVIGFAGDVAATELLFTSLLVQAQTAMHAAAAATPAGARARSRGFRSAFLTSYAYRIGARLAEINAGVISQAEVETGRSILPVLAARSSEVDAAVDEMFDRIKPTSTRRGYDADGWAGGRLAADRAKLNAGDLTRPSKALTSAPD
jgi:hypothetical protein